jgi:DNA-binding transcriptional LysR family regulator
MNNMINNLIMEYDLLRVLVQVANSQNFRSAADALGLSQASVTNKLAALEANYSAPIFVLEGKKKILTPFGKALVEAARKSFADFDLSLRDVEHRFVEKQTTPLRIGCRPEIFMRIARHLPDEALYRFVPMSGPKVAPAILAGEIDFGFSAIVPDSLNLLAKKAFKSSVRLVVHKNLISAKMKKPLWKDEDFIINTPALSYGDDGHLLVDLCRARGILLSQLNIRFTTDSWTILRELVLGEKGFAVIPSYIDLGDNVIAEPLPATVCEHLDFQLIIRSAYKDVPLFKQLLKVAWA